MSADVPSSRLLVEYPPVELLDLRDENTRVWSVGHEVEVARADGTKAVDVVEGRVIEKGSGICYRNEVGNLLPSNPHWEATANGFVLRECAYGLSAGKTLAVPVLYKTRGAQLFFRPALLKTSGGATEELLAAVDTAVGAVIDAQDPRRLVFPGAFGALGDVEILAEKGALHQNLILRECPEFKVDSRGNDGRVSLYTELSLDAFLRQEGARVELDSEVIAGAGMGLIADRSKTAPIAFYRREFASDGTHREVLEHFFAESVVYPASSGMAATVIGERAERSLFRDPESNVTYLVESVPVSALLDTTYPLVWDFWSIPQNYQQGEPWVPAYTYRVTADFYVSSGTLVILPGTVVKLDPYVSIYIGPGAAVVAKGEPYNYITFTRTRDDNCGERITGPQDLPYSCALYLMDGSRPDSIVQYCKMGKGYFGINCVESLTQPIAHNIIRGGNALWIGIIVQFGATTSCWNNLVTGSTWLGIQYYGALNANTNITNNTVDGANVGIQLQYSACELVTDNLLANCGAVGISVSSTPVGLMDHNGFWRCTTPVSGAQIGPNSVVLGYYSDPYDRCSVGDFYLDTTAGEGAELRDRPGGRTAEAAGLAGAQFTVDRPWTAPTSVTTNQYWLKAGTDTGIVDIGYHHNRVDWVLDNANTTVTNCGLILVPGLVIAINGQGKSLRISTEGKIISPGNPYDSGPNVIASKRSVSMSVESSLKLYPVGSENDLQMGIRLLTGSIFDSRIRNTVFRGLHKGIKAERWCVFPIKNCQFDQNITGLEASGGGVPAFNNVFAWNKKGISASLPASGRAEYRNNTFDGNWEKGLELTTVSGCTVVIKDNLFTSNPYGISVAGQGTIEYGNNGFYANTNPEPQPYPKEGDVFLGASPYHMEGVITKRWFLNQACALINAGSRTTVAAKLLPYTTAYSQSYDVGKIDIGYHAFTATGPANPDPDAPTVSITGVKDQFNYEPPEPLQGAVDITVETVDAALYSTPITQLYVDGEFIGNVSPLTPGAQYGADTLAYASYDDANTYDPYYLADWHHTAQALAQSTKPATGRSDPVSFDVYNWVYCVSVSTPELALPGTNAVELSGLVCAQLAPLESRVYVSNLAPGWTWEFPDEVPFDARVYDEWPRLFFKVLGDDGAADHVVHQSWDGTDGAGQDVYDGLYRLQMEVKLNPWYVGSWTHVSAFSMPITEAEVAIFLPDFSLWDVVSAQAVIEACWRLELPYRVVVDQNANWDNLKTFLTTARPPGRYPSALYIATHANWEIEYRGQYYKLTSLSLSDSSVYATTRPDEGGDLPADFVQSQDRKFISDPIWGAGLRDPRYPDYELSETGWVKFVWVDGCYSNVIWSGTLNDMARALGMNSGDNDPWFGDQSYIGFRNLTPNGFYNQWVSVLYTWIFWYYLSVASGVEPDWTVWQVFDDKVSWQVTQWALAGYPYTLPLEYMLAIDDISFPSYGAKLKDHIDE